MFKGSIRRLIGRKLRGGLCEVPTSTEEQVKRAIRGVVGSNYGKLVYVVLWQRVAVGSRDFGSRVGEPAGGWVNGVTGGLFAPCLLLGVFQRWDVVFLCTGSGCKNYFVGLSSMTLLTGRRLSLTRGNVTSTGIILANFIIMFTVLVLLVVVVGICNTVVRGTRSTNGGNGRGGTRAMTRAPTPIITTPITPTRTSNISSRIITMVSTTITAVCNSSRGTEVGDVGGSSSNNHST